MNLIIKKLSLILTKKDKKFLFFLILFSIIISLIETIGISAIMPFFKMAMDSSFIQENKYLSQVYKFLNFKDESSFILFFGVSLIFFYIFRGVINLFYKYVIVKFSQSRYHLLAFRLFQNYMSMPYKKFSKKNSSLLTKTIINEASYLMSVVAVLLEMISEIFIFIFIYILFIYIDFKITLFLSIFLIFIFFLMTKTVSKVIKEKGKDRELFQKKFYEVINKSFHNFKILKLQSSNDKYVLKEFNSASFWFSKSNTVAKTLTVVPKLFFESFSFSIIIVIVLYLLWSYQGDTTSILSVLSVFVLGLYRLMPSVNKIMNSYNAILFYYKSLDIVFKDLNIDGEKSSYDNLEFEKTITLENLSFEYRYNRPIIKSLSLTINKGEKIAFIGESGSGKSTIVDIIIGLYQPKSGMVKIDNQVLTECNIDSWRRKIGYIPQDVYLFDGTIAENVVFGNEYNHEKLIDCLKRSKIYDFLLTKEAENTCVGESGVMLSGGQKQRIAIARALYLEPEVLVLDEATSALDSNTELEIMKEIYDISMDKTLIIIAHRLSTIEKCDKIYKLENGQIIKDSINV